MSGNALVRFGIVLASILAGVVSGATRAAVSFAPLEPGIDFATFQTSPPGRAPIEFTVLRVDPKRARVVVVDLRHISANQPAAGSSQVAYSLRELDRLQKPRAIINGGFTNSLVLPQPSGLVTVAGRTTSKLNAASKSQTGVLCISRDGTISIQSIKKGGLSRCLYAVQAGPLVVEDPGVNGIGPKAIKDQYVRSVIAVDSKGRAFLIHTTRASLFDIAEALTGAEAGIQVRVALNLDGDADSGFVLHRKKDSDVILGNIDATIPTAVAVMSRPVGFPRPAR